MIGMQRVAVSVIRINEQKERHAKLW